MQMWTGAAIPHESPKPYPTGWNYDMWLGPVQWRPFVPARVNGWAYFWDTGEGMHTDMGTHYTDQMQWVLGTDDTGPVEFEATDLVWPDPKQFMSETAISGTFKFRYANGVRGFLYQRGAFKDRYIRYIGDEGWIQVDDETDIVTAEPKSILDAKTSGWVSWANAGAHIRNLLDVHSPPPPTALQPRSRPSRADHLRGDHHQRPARQDAALGSGEGAVRRRNRQPHVVSPAARPLAGLRPAPSKLSRH
jgi:predicted dehydrogenase